MALDYGAIHIERGTGNAMNFYGYWEIDYDFDPTISDLYSDTRLSYDYGIIKRTVYIVDAMFTTTADAETFLSTLKTLQAAGTMTLELQIEAADYFEIDGTNTSLEVFCTKISKLKRITSGYGTPSVYKIPFMIFKEG